MDTIFALLAGVAALGAANIARAQYVIEEPDLPDTPADVFSGPHIEVSIGGYHAKNTSYDDINTTTDISGSKNGLTYGGAFGYDIPLTENWTVGAEAGFYTGSSQWTNPGLVAGTFGTQSIKAGRDIALVARAGYAFTLKTQIYGKLGVTIGHFGINGSDGNETLYQSIDASGLRAGLGIEHHLRRTIYLKLEYDYSKYGTGPFTYHQTTPDASSYDVHVNRHQLMSSLGFRF